MTPGFSRAMTARKRAPRDAADLVGSEIRERDPRVDAPARGIGECRRHHADDFERLLVQRHRTPDDARDRAPKRRVQSPWLITTTRLRPATWSSAISVRPKSGRERRASGRIRR